MAADHELEDKLRQEAPGIMQKLVQGCLDFQYQQLAPPLTVRQASAQYLLDQNVIARFVEEKCDRSNPEATATTTILWKAVQKWAEEAKENLPPRKDFTERFEKLGLKVKRTAHTRGVIAGIQLKTSDEAENEDEPELRDPTDSRYTRFFNHNRQSE